jgi:undecaprenyl-diphosphatase
VVIGVLAHGFIKSVLFSPLVVAISLIVGGFVILAVEAWRPVPRYAAVENFPIPMFLAIGFCQCLAMIPGVSRSGASIMGALMLGANRRSAAEFSFFLAIPTMLGATVYDLYKNRGGLDGEAWYLIAIGFGVAFLAAIVVVRVLIAWVGQHGFAPFAWYRIVLGAAMLAVLGLR